MSIEKEAYICQRCNQVCFDPTEVPFANRSPILMCFECLDDAIVRSGGRRIVEIDGEAGIIFRKIPPL